MCDTSIPELRWLTIDQALADLAQFIQIVKSDSFQNGIFKNAKVILAGCSYAGTMATWMRLAYPHLIDASFSDSGPLHAQEDFPEYLETITEAIRAQGSQECVDSIREGMVGLQALVQSNPQTHWRVQSKVSDIDHQEAILTITDTTCSQLDASSGLDLATFYWFGITETFAYLVQYAYPGDIPSACNVLTDASVPDATQRLANWIRQQSSTQPCIESRYSMVLNQHTNTSFDAPDSTMRLWTYQLCVEFGWWQTTSGEDQVFLDVVPLSYFHQMCRDFFSSYFDDERTRYGIERTNTFFGGLTFQPDRVVTVQGSHDPWSPMGPNESHATFLAPVYVVPQASHCMAIQPTSSDDPELARVQRNVKNHILGWVGADPIHDGATSVLASTVLVLAGIVAAIL
ncbi:serine carboxypeptidase s28 domain-containing protein [Phthorimaea operculella]|nr:serine carboxypeptidase s28 domain-containing protein [Phthorimaea operculella]